MQKFDPTSIYNTSLDKLNQNPNWKAVANNSVISALLKSSAEINSETARYAEYLFKESRWDTAQNSSSILSMANMLGYQPKRKISARGKLYVSVDPRTHLVGKTLSAHTFEELTASSPLNWQKPTEDLVITPTCSITDSKGNSYIASATTFKRENYYTTVEIMQGSRKSVFIDISTIRNTSTSSKLDPYLYIPVTIKGCENADNPTSKSYFRVYKATSLDGGKTLSYQEYRVTNTSLLSSSTDYDVEVYNDIYNQGLFYLKFNNDSERGTTLDISRNTSLAGIRIDYVESTGSAGNLLDLYENFTLTNVTNSGATTTYTLYGVNSSALIGGADEEKVYEIKKNAPKYYINNYTAGTKEAYENTIGNMNFNVEIGGTPTNLKPKRVQVYGGTQTTTNGSVLPVTYISFLAEGLEDIQNSSTSEDAYTAIEESLNYYLTRLKSPQDTLKFTPPNYIAYALGIKCKVSREDVDDIAQLEGKIRDLIDEKWGSTSADLDFGRNFFPSQITNEIMNNFPEVKAVSHEVEATQKLDWTSENVTRINPKGDGTTSTEIRVIHVPFNFSPTFLGKESTIGFKDHRVGADYVMRVDFMYKKPRTMNVSTNYNTSLFVPDVKTARNDPFYVLRDTNQTPIWPTFPSPRYTDLNGASRLENSKQYYFQNKVFNDNDFRKLVDESSNEYVATISTYLTSPGAVDDYLIYFSSNYDESAETIGNGWIEMTFDPIYRLLSNFALYDTTVGGLKDKLAQCPLALLKCGNDDVTDVFEAYKKILEEYVEVYVSMRPVDEDLKIDTSTTLGGSSVLYIDSYDSATTSTNRSNLTSDKRTRMISVDCEYEE